MTAGQRCGTCKHCNVIYLLPGKNGMVIKRFTCILNSKDPNRAHLLTTLVEIIGCTRWHVKNTIGNKNTSEEGKQHEPKQI